MNQTSYTNEQELIEALQGSGPERRQALNHFFENPRLLAWVLRHVQVSGGSQHDGKDVFEESFIIFERQVRTGHFQSKSSLETYFQGIARWQWMAFRRKNRPSADLENLPDLPSEEHSPEKILISEERRVMLSGLLVQVGERCQKLLGLFQLNYSMWEIRETLGYSSDQVASNEVHSCREKLKKIIQRDPESVDVLKNRS